MLRRSWTASSSSVLASSARLANFTGTPPDRSCVMRTPSRLGSLRPSGIRPSGVPPVSVSRARVARALGPLALAVRTDVSERVEFLEESGPARMGLERGLDRAQLHRAVLAPALPERLCQRVIP